jgi:hypothetical protein
MVNCFEVHLGFPDDPSHIAFVPIILERLRSDHPQWTCSDVRNVFVKRPDFFDPHNVPGILRSLVSREIVVESGSDGDQTVLNAAQAALHLLSEAGLLGARLEIEYPFGYLSARLVKDRIVHTELRGDPITISPSEIVFDNAVAIADAPRWEIHVIVEPLAPSAAKEHTVYTVPDVIESHGVVIEQTIEYRSQHMKDSGQSGYKFISTSYYQNVEDLESEARRLFYKTTLCNDFFQRGYTIKLLLEHIVGCFKPISMHKPTLKRPRLEVPSAQ